MLTISNHTIGLMMIKYFLLILVFVSNLTSAGEIIRYTKEYVVVEQMCIFEHKCRIKTKHVASGDIVYFRLNEPVFEGESVYVNCYINRIEDLKCESVSFIAKYEDRR